MAPSFQLRLLHSGRGNFRPHCWVQRLTQAAEGTAQASAGLKGPSQASRRERGRCLELRIVAETGKLTDRSVNRRGRNASRARKSPRPLRKWHVPNPSCPPSPTLGASRGLPARFPASLQRCALLIGGAHVGGSGLCSDAPRQAASAACWLFWVQCLCGVGGTRIINVKFLQRGGAVYCGSRRVPCFASSRSSKHPSLPSGRAGQIGIKGASTNKSSQLATGARLLGGEAG